MSRKHKKYRFQQQQQQALVSTTSAAAVTQTPVHAGHLPEVSQEMQNLRTDLWHLFAVNAFLLAGLLALYYTNRSSDYLYRWFDRFI